MSPAKVEEEEQAAADAAPVFTSQKSSASVTSSEPTGTDSHCEEDVNTDALTVTVTLPLMYSHTCTTFLLLLSSSSSFSCCEFKC